MVLIIFFGLSLHTEGTNILQNILIVFMIFVFGEHKNC